MRERGRRRFLQQAAGGGAGLLAALCWPDAAHACEVPITGAPWPSVNGWEHRTIMHFLNTIVPGDDGRALFSGDGYPLRSGGDRTAGAWSACVLDVFYDPYYGIAGLSSNALAAALDWATRFKGYGLYFHRVSQSQQLRVVDQLAGMSVGGADVVNAASLALAAALGAARNPAVTNVLGWGGPTGGYYDGARHPLSRWQQPERMTEDGNLP
jgi:hypothetical protein